MYRRAAAASATAVAPIAIPAIAPVERLEWCDEVLALVETPVTFAVGLLGVDVAVGVEAAVVVKGSSASSGHGCPGVSMKDESLANCFWFCRDVVALGLTTPTICQLIHDPVAPQ